MNIGLRHVEGRGSRTQIVKKRDGEMETEGGRMEEDNGILSKENAPPEVVFVWRGGGGEGLGCDLQKKIFFEMVVSGEVISHQERKKRK